jgi:hypothetical protein
MIDRSGVFLNKGEREIPRSAVKPFFYSIRNGDDVLVSVGPRRCARGQRVQRHRRPDFEPKPAGTSDF